MRESSDANQRSQAEIELDAGPGKSFRIWVEPNVLFVGTMNEDGNERRPFPIKF